MVLIGTPLALAMGFIAFQIAPDRRFALAAFAVAIFEGVAGLLIYGPQLTGGV